MSDFDDINDPEELLGVLAGAVSVCWEPKPTGVFDSAAASEFVDEAIARLRVLISDAAIRADEREKVLADDRLYQRAVAAARKDERKRLTPQELDRLPFIRCPDCGHRIHVDLHHVRDEAREEFLEEFVAEDAAVRILRQERERLRERLIKAWDRDEYAIRFNKAGDDLTPAGRVRKWLRTVEL